jgi:hypothetical protein
MVDFYKGTIPIIDTESTLAEHVDMLHPKDVTFGLVPRDYNLFPQEMFAPPSEMDEVPPSEWDARYDEQEELQSSLEHIYLSGPNGGPAFICLDQNGHGYCWAYSTGQAIMIDRLKRNLPLVRLNPHATAAIIKGGRDQGGWCGESAKFGREIGYAEQGTGPGQWPLHSRDLRFDTPELRRQMAKFKIDEEWVDLGRNLYSQNLTQNQVASEGFNNNAGPGDYNWWGHSVCRLRWVRVERGGWGQLILNSWRGWGRHGLGVLIGNKAVCNGAIGIRSTTA